MMKALLTTILLTIPAVSQVPTSTTGPAQTVAICSPANTGNQNTFTITCGIGEKQGKEIIGILNKLLANQADSSSMMNKLNGCVEQVQQVREQQLPWKLTDDQKKKLRESLSGTKAKVAIYALSSDNNSTLFGGDLLEVLQSANWDFGGRSLYYYPGVLPSPDQIGVMILVSDRYSPEIQPLLLPAHALNQTLLNAGVKTRWATLSDEELLHLTSFGEKDLGSVIIVAVGAKPSIEAHP